jgi:hypothetical protein
MVGDRAYHVPVPEVWFCDNSLLTPPAGCKYETGLLSARRKLMPVSAGQPLDSPWYVRSSCSGGHCRQDHADEIAVIFSGLFGLGNILCFSGIFSMF